MASLVVECRFSSASSSILSSNVASCINKVAFLAALTRSGQGLVSPEKAIFHPGVLGSSWSKSLLSKMRAKACEQ